MVKRKNNNKMKLNDDILLKLALGVTLLASLGLNVIQHYTIKEYKNLENTTPKTMEIETKSFAKENDAQKVFDTVVELSQNQYRIKSGDTLAEIVNSKYGKYDYNLLMGLAKYNNIKNVDKIITGDVISIPSAEELKKISVGNNTIKQIPQSTLMPATLTPARAIPEIMPAEPTSESISEIKEDVNTLKTDMTEVKSDISVMKDDIKANAEKIEENTSNITTLQTETEKTQNELTEVKNDISEIKTEVKDNISELKEDVKANSDNINLLSTESNNTQIEVNNIKTDITDLQNNVERHDNNITNVDKKLESHSKFENTEIQKINNKLEVLESEMNSGKLSISEALKRLNAIENSLDKLSENQISKDEFMETISSENSNTEQTEIKEDISIPEIEETEVYNTPVIEDENEYEYEYENVSYPSSNIYMEDESDIMEDEDDVIEDNVQEPEIINVDDSIQDDNIEIEPTEDENLEATPSVEEIKEIEEIKDIEVKPIKPNPMNIQEVQSIALAKTR